MTRFHLLYALPPIVLQCHQCPIPPALPTLAHFRHYLPFSLAPKSVQDFNISSLQLSRSRLWRFRASSGKYALLYGLSLSVNSLPGCVPLPFLWSSRAWALLLSSASLCKRSARNLSMELEKKVRQTVFRIFGTPSPLLMSQHTHHENLQYLETGMWWQGHSTIGCYRKWKIHFYTLENKLCFLVKRYKGWLMELLLLTLAQTKYWRYWEAASLGKVTKKRRPYLSPLLLFCPLSFFSNFLLWWCFLSFTASAFFISFSGSKLSFNLRSFFSLSSSLIPFLFSFACLASFSFSSSFSLPVFMYHGVTSDPGWGPRETSNPMARSCFSWRKQGKVKAV